MNILFDVGHPAHVHLFRPSWEILGDRGHNVYVAARDKDVLVDLLQHCDVKSSVISSQKGGTINNLIEMAKRDIELLKLTKRLGIDLLVGSSYGIPHVGWLTRRPSLAFSEDDAEYKFDRNWNYRLFGTYVCTPDSLQSDLGKRQIRYPSYHELAYLHPDQFTPNPRVLTELDVKEGERFFILRFVALKAYHDARASGLGLTTRRRLVRELSKFGRVFITAEGKLPPDLEPYRFRTSPTKMHDVLYYATMLVSDSQTMTVEAAVLGTPAIRCNTFVGRCSIIEELEHKYGLTYGFLPKDVECVFAKIVELLEDDALDAKWQQRRARMLKDKIDLTAWMVDLIDGYPESLCVYQGKQRRFQSSA